MVLAAEATAMPVPPAGQPLWAQIVEVVLMLVITAFATPYLARKAAAAKAEAVKLKAEGLVHGVNARHILTIDLKRFLIDFCATTMEKKLPALLPQILAGDMDASDIKAELKKWGMEAKNSAKAYFKTQGLDIVELVGDAYLDQAIRWAADNVSPFPGKETAVTLAEEKYSNWLVAKGVDYVRTKWLKGETPESDGITTPPVPSAEVVTEPDTDGA
jgi:hypothetical protein